MAVFVATDFNLTINGTDFSDHLAQIEITENSDAVEITAFGDTHRQRTAGLGDATVTLSFHQDFAAGEVHAIIQPIYQSYATIVAKPTSSGVSATNPTVTLHALVDTYTPLSASVGDLATMDVTWPLGTGTITYATA